MGKVAGVAPPSPSPFGRSIVQKRVIFCFLLLQPPFWFTPDKYSHEGLHPPPFSRVSRFAFGILCHFIVNGISHTANTRHLKSLI